MSQIDHNRRVQFGVVSVREPRPMERPGALPTPAERGGGTTRGLRVALRSPMGLVHLWEFAMPVVSAARDAKVRKRSGGMPDRPYLIARSAQVAREAIRGPFGGDPAVSSIL